MATTPDRTPETGNITTCAAGDCLRVAKWDGSKWEHVNPPTDGHPVVLFTCPVPGCGWWPRFVIDDEADWDDMLAIHAGVAVHDAEAELDAREVAMLGGDS